MGFCGSSFHSPLSPHQVHVPMALPPDVFSRRRDSPGDSSPGANPFYLSLQTGKPLKITSYPVLEFLCIPHIGSSPFSHLNQY
jgi:hypothetical protein